jgi:hypothetical protein
MYARETQIDWIARGSYRALLFICFNSRRCYKGCYLHVYIHGQFESYSVPASNTAKPNTTQTRLQSRFILGIYEDVKHMTPFRCPDVIIANIVEKIVACTELSCVFQSWPCDCSDAQLVLPLEYPFLCSALLPRNSEHIMVFPDFGGCFRSSYSWHLGLW